jgi:hypothetical protein
MSTTINYTVSSGLNATLTTSGNYNFLQILPGSSNTGSITFSQSSSPILPFFCDILIVAGGGGGGGGWYGYNNTAQPPNIYTDYIGGGGGAGGQVIQYKIPISNSYNTVLNLTIGTGGIYTNPSGSSAGGNSSITSNAFYAESIGGAPGASGVIANPSPSQGGVGINGSGTGGLGGCSVYENNINMSQTNSTAATAYTIPDFFGFPIGPISGGGGGGNSNGETPTQQPGNGAGGLGGYYNNSNILINPTNGVNGGGGGGAAYFGAGGTTPTSTPGSNGGNGIIWLRFPSSITINLSNYNIPTYGDLSNIFYPLSLGGITGSTGTGYNYNTGSTIQDLTNLFSLKIPGSTAAPQTYYSSNFYGGQDLNQVFQNINYPFPFIIISSQYITINIYYANGYYGIIFQQNGTKNIGPPNPSSGQNGTATIQFTQSISNVNILVVGGGGGGGGGNYNTLDGTPFCSGGGAAGGGITIVSNTSINTTPLSITVGCAGTGNSGNNGGFGNDAGGGGNSSIISYYDSTNNNISYTSGGGSPGYGSGAVTPGGGGGNGGSTSQTGGSDSNGGGGGGGGGGSNDTGSGNIYQGGTGGSNAIPGNTGGVGQVPPPSTSGPTNIGQNGGASWTQYITIPFYSSSSVTFSLGGGGGGGGANSGNTQGIGGGAGSGTFGTGNSSGTSNGVSANNSITGLNPGYGGGGGGGGSGNGNTNSGGDGGNGVVMIWWPA